MNSPAFNQVRNFLLRFFRAFTGHITDPCLAWVLFLLLIFHALVLGWGLPQILGTESVLIKDSIHFYSGLIDSQAEIREQLDKALTATGDCQ